MSIGNLSMTDLLRLYRLIRDYKKIEFISEFEFSKNSSINYDTVHDQISFDKSYIDNAITSFSSNSSLLSALLKNHLSKGFAAVDFGGGLGKGFYELDTDVQKHCQLWLVVEKLKFIKKVPIHLLHRSLSFSDKIENFNVSGSCLKVGYSNSGIQYSGRMEGVVSELAELGLDLLVFERIPLSLSQTDRVLFVRQRSNLRSNYTKNFSLLGARVFYNFELLPESRFVGCLQDLGFDVSLEKISGDVFSNLKYRIGLFNIIARRK